MGLRGFTWIVTLAEASGARKATARTALSVRRASRTRMGRAHYSSVDRGTLAISAARSADLSAALSIEPPRALADDGRCCARRRDWQRLIANRRFALHRQRSLVRNKPCPSEQALLDR